MVLSVKTHLRAGLLAAVVIAVTACTPVVRNHGYIPVPEDLSRVVVGQDTRESVLEIAGPPTAGGVLDGSGFYYVASRFRHYGAVAPQEISREVLAIRFGADGRVSNIERFGLDEGRVVVLSRRVTDDNIADTTFIRQLLGNIGRVDAGQFLGES